jgi:hypothetical protein
MDMLEFYREATGRNIQRIAALHADDLMAATPCRDWTVAALLDHLIGGLEMFAAALGNPVSSDEGPPATIDDLATAYEA